MSNLSLICMRNSATTFGNCHSQPLAIAVDHQFFLWPPLAIIYDDHLRWSPPSNFDLVSSNCCQPISNTNCQWPLLATFGHHFRRPPLANLPPPSLTTTTGHLRLPLTITSIDKFFYSNLKSINKLSIYNKSKHWYVYFKEFL